MTAVTAPSWSGHTAPELRKLAADGAIALWPIGSTEQHGSHLVTGFDLVSARTVCERTAASLVGDAVVLPGLPLGASDHWLPLGATLSLRAETLTALVVDVTRSLDAAGFRRLVIVNGHAGNVGPVLAALGSHSQTSVRVELVSYWNLVDPVELTKRSRVDGGGIGHAGEIETSIGLHLGASLVREECLPVPPGVQLGDDRPGSRATVFMRAPRPLEESPTGVYGDPSAASPELGAFVIDQASAALIEHCRQLLAEDR